MSNVKRLISDLKSRITRQKCNFIFDNAKNLVLESIKIYADKKEYKDTVRVSAKDLKAIGKIAKSDVQTFRKAFYHLTRKDGLAIDSESQKLNLCKHARARQHCFNQIAKAVKRPDLVVDYAKKSKAPKEKAVKGKAGKGKAVSTKAQNKKSK